MILSILLLQIHMNSKTAFGAVRLRQASVAVKFVTNTTKESKRILLERLQRLNFDLQVKCATMIYLALVLLQ